MSQEYSWEQSSTYEAPRGDGFGWAVLVAVVLALLLHVAFFVWGVNRFITVEITESQEWVSEPIRMTAKDMDIEPVSTAPPEEEIERPKDDAELIANADDVLPQLSEVELDIAPISEAALPDFKIEKPLLDGSEDGDLVKATVGPRVETDQPEHGQTDNLFLEAKIGQVIVDRGKPLSDVFDPNSLAKELGRKKGGGGLAPKGVIKGYTGLAAYAKMAPGDLQKNKASIGSDLLFDFGVSTLRDDARPTLMTVAMLIDRNPDMYCWVEGHTDLVGSEASNLVLSQKRGDAVKNWLVNSLKISPQRIIVRAFGEEQPVVLEGTVAEQAPNRRVDIKMRKAKPKKPEPKKAEPIVPVVPEIPKAEVIPVAQPVAEPVEEKIPKAEVIEPLEPAQPAEPEIPRAIPVEEAISE